MYRGSLWAYAQWSLWLLASAMVCVAWLSSPDPSRDALLFAPVLTVTSGLGMWLFKRRRKGA